MKFNYKQGDRVHFYCVNGMSGNGTIVACYSNALPIVYTIKPDCSLNGDEYPFDCIGVLEYQLTKL